MKHVCLFCYNCVTTKVANVGAGVTANKSKNTVDEFLKLLGRFLKNDESLEGSPHSLQEWLSYCRDCGWVLSSFSEVYHQMKCLELQLDWKVKSLVDTMTSANKVPSRHRQLRQIIAENIEEEEESGNNPRVLFSNLKLFRNNLIQKCVSRLSKSQPRVVIKREGEDDPQTSDALSLSGQLSPRYDLDDCRDDDFTSTHEEEDTEEEGDSSFKSVSQLSKLRSPKHPTTSVSRRGRKPAHQPVSKSPTTKRKRSHPFNLCSKSFPNKFRLKLHIHKDHPRSSKPPRNGYYCDICKLSFKIYGLYRAHKTRSTSHQILKRLLTKNHRGSIKKEYHDEGGDLSTLVEVKKEPSLNNDDSDKESVISEEAGTTVGNVKKLYCYLDGCRRGFRTKSHFDDHRRLHAQGDYKCNFCKVVESNVIKLSLHELNRHGHGSASSNAFFHCPRCTYETDNLWFYKHHFAKVHIPGFERIVKTGNIRKCKICQLRLLKHNAHVQRWHKKTAAEGEEILNCNVDGCVAYFVGKYDPARKALGKHKREVHELADLDAGKFLETFVREGNFTCKLCNKKFSTFFGLRTHGSRYHRKFAITPSKNPQRNVLICPVVKCTEYFRTEEDLQNHQWLHGSFKCEFCTVVKDYAPDLAIHESEEHAMDTDDKSEVKNAETTKLFSCSRCTSSYTVKGTFQRHFVDTHLIQSNTRPTCPICGAQNAHHSTSAHFKTHHKIDGVDPSKIFRCDLCPAYFLKAVQSYHHKMLIHYKKKCPVCERSFRTPRALKSHMERVHREFRAFPNFFPCNLANCTRQFATKEELEKHQMNSIHDDVTKRVKCLQCEKEFQNKTFMKRHMKNVHTEPTFVCSECGKACKTKHNLDIHMHKHIGPEGWKFQCSQCDRKWATKAKLEEHMRKHTKEKPYVCQYCGEKYSYRRSWKNHVLTLHSDMPDLPS